MDEGVEQQSKLVSKRASLLGLEKRRREEDTTPTRADGSLRAWDLGMDRRPLTRLGTRLRAGMGAYAREI